MADKTERPLDMKEEFKMYLIASGYKERTPSGNPSTVYDYVRRIDNVCKWEGTDWEGLKNNIDRIITEYDVGGTKEQDGSRSHHSVINALRCFRAFLNNRPEQG